MAESRWSDKALSSALGIGLNGVKGDVLVFLGMAPVFDAVEIGPIGLQDMLDPVTKGLDKGRPVALKVQGALAEILFDPGKRSQGEALFF